MTNQSDHWAQRWEEPVRKRTLFLFFATLSLPIAFQQIALGCLLACMVYTLWRTRRPLWNPHTPTNWSLLFFFGALLLSTALSPDPFQSLIGYRKLWLIGAGFAVYILVQDRREAEQLLCVALAVAVLVAAYSIVQHFTGIDLAKQLVGKESNLDPFWFGREEGYRAKGLHPSGITYAHNLLFPQSLLTAWGLAPQVPKPTRLLLILGWILMLFALFFSLTRGVWVAYGLVLILCGIVRGGRSLLGAIAGVVICGLLLMSAGEGVRERFLSTFDSQTDIGRSQIWLANTDMIKERPLTGWGFGNYKQFRAPFYERYPEADTHAHAHNNFLQMWVDTGIIGLASFLFLCGAILAAGWRAYAGQQTEPLKSLVLGGWLGMVGFLIGGLTQYNFGDAEVAIVWWATVGLMLRLAAFVTETEKRDLPEEYRPR